MQQVTPNEQRVATPSLWFPSQTSNEHLDHQYPPIQLDLGPQLDRFSATECKHCRSNRVLQKALISRLTTDKGSPPYFGRHAV
jgi:hypothetical protein